MTEEKPYYVTVGPVLCARFQDELNTLKKKGCRLIPGTITRDDSSPMMWSGIMELKEPNIGTDLPEPPTTEKIG